MLAPNDVIAVGFRAGIDVHLLCTQSGLDHLPNGLEAYSPSGEYFNVQMPLTEKNLVALRLCGVSLGTVAELRNSIS